VAAESPTRLLAATERDLKARTMAIEPSAFRARAADERGAILIQVGVAILVLSAFSMFIIDYGVLWVSRHQAQNAADAGALAGATALALDDFDDRSDTGPAKVSAQRFAQANTVWGEQPDVQMATDVRFYSDAEDDFPASCDNDDCVRVDVYRNQTRLNPLPTFFGWLVGVFEQGVRATATAQAAAANASDCLKPWAVADKWEEHNPEVAPWDPTQTFDPTGATPDVYIPPSEDGSSSGTSFTLANDLGTKLVLKAGKPKDAINPGWFQALDLGCQVGGNGGNCYRDNISGCADGTWKVGDDIPKENGDMVGPTDLGTDALVALDKFAKWDPMNKKVVGSCVGPPYTCSQPGYKQSPRIVAVPVFDLANYMATGGPGKGTVHVVQILGFFVEDVDKKTKDVVGYIATKADLKVSNGGNVSPDAAFIRAVQLVR
jgi:Flp pilus assembly protein TadG